MILSSRSPCPAEENRGPGAGPAGGSGRITNGAATFLRAVTTDEAPPTDGSHGGTFLPGATTDGAPTTNAGGCAELPPADQTKGGRALLEGVPPAQEVGSADSQAQQLCVLAKIQEGFLWNILSVPVLAGSLFLLPTQVNYLCCS